MGAILDKVPANRLLALDVFRGITITAMILVNNPGNWSHVYPPLLHADWHGWTPTDLIFPFFLFIVGVAMTMSMAGQQARGVTNAGIMKAGAVRALKLFGLGLFLAAFWYNFTAPDYSWFEDRIEGLRVMGVLQRIGLAYIIALPVIMLWRWRGQAVALVVFLLVYQLLMMFVPYSDASGQTWTNMWEHGNSFAAWIDHQIFGAAHNYYGNATPFAFDPEGLLSTLPAVATVLSGSLVGLFLQAEQHNARKASALLFVGLVITVAGMGMDALVPINKALWTPSYVVLTSGLACAVLGFSIWLLDIKGWKGWSAPFVVFGANAIGLYMISGVLIRIMMMIRLEETSLAGASYQGLVAIGLAPINASLTFALLFLALNYVVLYTMYKRDIFWKV